MKEFREVRVIYHGDAAHGQSYISVGRLELGKLKNSMNLSGIRHHWAEREIDERVSIRVESSMSGDTITITTAPLGVPSIEQPGVLGPPSIEPPVKCPKPGVAGQLLSETLGLPFNESTACNLTYQGEPSECIYTEQYGPLAIGFNFTYMGKTYTECQVDDSGMYLDFVGDVVRDCEPDWNGLRYHPEYLGIDGGLCDPWYGWTCEDLFYYANALTAHLAQATPRICGYHADGFLALKCTEQPIPEDSGDRGTMYLWNTEIEGRKAVVASWQYVNGKNLALYFGETVGHYRVSFEVVLLEKSDDCPAAIGLFYKDMEWASSARQACYEHWNAYCGGHGLLNGFGGRQAVIGLIDNGLQPYIYYEKSGSDDVVDIANSFLWIELDDNGYPAETPSGWIKP